MNICICTTPIRPVPTTYPPFGSMAIIDALGDIGENAIFYNIDYFRFTEEQIISFFTENKFDIVGISAVVSTAYAYTKYLSALIRRVSPGSKIIVGGNLAASAEILLRKCFIDYCVVGDGENIIQELVKVIRDGGLSDEVLSKVKGICFLDKKKDFIFTGFGQKPKAAEIKWPNYGLLEREGSINHFISSNIDARFRGSKKTLLNEYCNSATIVINKGCVARCTFCHRWEKGYRSRPVDQVINHIIFLQEKYKVGFLDISDENFGSDHKATWDIVAKLGELGIVWRAAGVRTSTVTKEELTHWKNNGCIAVYFGIESGSQVILDVMEKKTTVEQNINALRWVYEAGLETVPQLVLGMPGENAATIKETTDFLKAISLHVLSWVDCPPSESLSINYAQALPGTPLYEWARANGFVGTDMESEEEYLITISDTDAYDTDHFINYTGCPELEVYSWRARMLAEVDADHLRKKYNLNSIDLIEVIRYYLSMILYKKNIKIPNFLQSTLFVNKEENSLKKSGYFNITSGVKFAPLLLHPLTAPLCSPILYFLLAISKKSSKKTFVKLLYELFKWKFIKTALKQNMPSKSLRKIIEIKSIDENSSYSNGMRQLRDGR